MGCFDETLTYLVQQWPQMCLFQWNIQYTLAFFHLTAADAQYIG